jgi:ABC-type sulfate/molybdate transport systems ATPase subunit
VNLSGGQKARVSLARAMYHALVSKKKKDVSTLVLLDDPLSAVDPAVAHQRDRCILGDMVKEFGCGVVLVTHQRQFMSACDHLLVLENGQVRSQGTFAEVSASGVDLSTLTQGPEDEARSRTGAFAAHTGARH